MGTDGDSPFRTIRYRRGVTAGLPVFLRMYSMQRDRRNIFQKVNLWQVAYAEGASIVRMTIIMSSAVTVRRRSIRSAHRPTFNGQTNLDEFLIEFRTVAAYNQWRRSWGAWGGRAHPILSVGGPCHITGPPNKMC
jgi:hypothetical protein